MSTNMETMNCPKSKKDYSEHSGSADLSWTNKIHYMKKTDFRNAVRINGTGEPRIYIKPQTS